jgi:xylan 1,4-beta-xylosidase
MRGGSPSLLALAAVAALSDPRLDVARPAEPPVARFDWFEYVGNDSVYRANPATRGQYNNPVLAGFYPDPSAIRVGDDYYLVTSSFSYFPGVPIFHSRDLMHWTQIGHVLDRPSQLPVKGRQISEGIFAPTIRHHGGTFYMITTCGSCGGNFIVTASNPAGHWSEPLWLPEVDGIDPSLFFDDDGRAYVINNGPPIGTPRYEGHRALWVQEYDPAMRRMTGPRTMVLDGGVDTTRNPIWIEAPHIFRHDGHYYLIAAEGGTADQHSEVVLRSDAVLGPWTAGPANPILTQRHLDVARQAVSSTGHADFIQTPKGEWWAVFLGARPYGPDLYNTGRETFLLPVSWHDGWPTIDGAEGPMAFTHAAPVAPAEPPPAIPTSGNFTVREQFDGGALPPYWTFIRAPGTSWYDLTSRRGWLTIHPRPDDLNGRGTPSFIGRRQQHTVAAASTALRFSPMAAGDRAGLAAFQNETHNYCLCIALENGRRVVHLERSATEPGAPAIVLASAPLAARPDETVYLKVDARGGRYDFSYARRPGAWRSLARDVDGTFLSTRVAGGFVGTMLGPYARSGGP